MNHIHQKFLILLFTFIITITPKAFSGTCTSTTTKIHVVGGTVVTDTAGNVTIHVPQPSRSSGSHPAVPAREEDPPAIHDDWDRPKTPGREVTFAGATIIPSPVAVFPSPTTAISRRGRAHSDDVSPANLSPARGWTKSHKPKRALSTGLTPSKGRRRSQIGSPLRMIDLEGAPSSPMLPGAVSETVSAGARSGAAAGTGETGEGHSRLHKYAPDDRLRIDGLLEGLNDRQADVVALRSEFFKLKPENTEKLLAFRLERAQEKLIERKDIVRGIKAEEDADSLIIKHAKFDIQALQTALEKFTTNPPHLKAIKDELDLKYSEHMASIAQEHTEILRESGIFYTGY